MEPNNHISYDFAPDGKHLIFSVESTSTPKNNGLYGYCFATLADPVLISASVYGTVRKTYDGDIAVAKAGDTYLFTLDEGNPDNMLSGLSLGTEDLTGLLPTQVVRINYEFPEPLLAHRRVGKKRYELTDHLGNVRAVVSDLKTTTLSPTGAVGTFAATVKQANDYYPFGSLLFGREVSDGGEDYRFTFQSQEGDDEIRGEGNSLNYKFRMHDPRIGRFFAVDPLAAKYPYNSSYAFSENRVVDGVELEGLEWQATDDKGNNVAKDAKNIADYKWTGYIDQGLYRINTVPKRGTVTEAQINYWVNGLEMSDYFGVSKDNTPVTESYVRAPWMSVLGGQLGLKEDKSSVSNPTIQAMIDQNNVDFSRADGEVPISNDNDPWCGVCVYNSIKTAGFPVTSNGWQTPALNTFYKNNWNEGIIIKNPAYGAVAVMIFSHVAFVHSYNKNYVWIIGGNQRADGGACGDGSEVNIRRYNRSQVSKYILPNSYSRPPLD